ncbi:hypothetical protein [Virgibacillus salexigens]|uniref:hypothetical protein n=1 Tax=Virgibacillus massiliensis TaxID=1462526 RepID=UPI00136F0AD4|nr:hypothetical protein [Virgibacillus massiliensis]MYL43888.1 hypothetical protein [Virgibacillus massiliensis]
MKNTKIDTPNFMVLRYSDKRKGICKVTICQKTLEVISEEVLKEIPDEWSSKDFFNLLSEGERFFGAKA